LIAVVGARSEGNDGRRASVKAEPLETLRFSLLFFFALENGMYQTSSSISSLTSFLQIRDPFSFKVSVSDSFFFFFLDGLIILRRTRAVTNPNKIQPRGRSPLFLLQRPHHQRLVLSQWRASRDLQRTQWDSLDNRRRLCVSTLSTPSSPFSPRPQSRILIPFRNSQTLSTITLPRLGLGRQRDEALVCANGQVPLRVGVPDGRQACNLFR
jgi:hypothetical protein